MDANPPPALVVVAVGAAERLLPRPAQLVGGVRHRSLGGSVFTLDAGGVPAAVRPRSRADRQRSGVSQFDGRRGGRGVRPGQLAGAVEQRRSLLSGDARRRSTRRNTRSPSRPTSTGPVRSDCSSRNALAAAAGRGVRVKILLDAVGSASVGAEILQILEKGGCHVAWYNPVRIGHLRRINNRTHRKSLIIDGRIGFTGGAGIADHWTGDAQDDKHWRDLQIRIEGPAVRPLQTGLRAELAGSHLRAGDRAGLLSVADPGRHARAADDHELAGDRRVHGSGDVLPGHFGGARLDRHRQPVLRSGSRLDRFVPGCHEARRAGARHGRRRQQRHAGDALQQRAPLRRAPRCGRRVATNTTAP